MGNYSVNKPEANAKEYWAKIPSKIIKTELTKRDLNYPDLVAKLKTLNIDISADDLRGRLSRGTFSAMFFLQCLKAIDLKNIKLEDSYFE